MKMARQLRFGENGGLEKRRPPKFKLGDKVKFRGRYGLSGIFEVDGVWWTWGDPIYCVVRHEDDHTIMSACVEEELVRC